MNKDILHYVVHLKFKKRQYFLLWNDGGKKPDGFAVMPKTSKFVVTRTTKALRVQAALHNLILDNQKPVLLDIDKLYRVLKNLKPSTSPQKKTCEFLLFSWNMLEDMGRSISVKKVKIGSDLPELYDKIFQGNNLLGTYYRPIFSKEEIPAIRKFLRSLWSEIYIKSDQFIG